MKRDKDNQWLDPLLSQRVGREPAEFDFQQWRREHPDEVRLLERGFETAARSRQTKIYHPLWRCIMESRVTRYSAAAVVVLAVAVILIQPGTRFGGRGVVLAEVAAKVNEMGNSVLKGRRTAWEQGREEPMLEATGTAYVSSEYGYMEEQYDADGNLTHRAYILKESRRFVLVVPSEKYYMDLSVSEEIFDRLAAVLTPSGLLAYITSGPYTELGRGQFNGLEVEGFETRNNQLFAVPGGLKFLLPVNSVTARVWVDVDSSLPASFEIDFATDWTFFTGLKKLRAEFRTDEIEWNAEIPEGTFDPNIPEDYRRISPESFAKENAAWIGVGALPIIGIIAHRRRRHRLRQANRQVIQSSVTPSGSRSRAAAWNRLR
jgi:hypothetical protein